MAESLLGVAGIILAYLGIGLGLVCTGWATRNSSRIIPRVMMAAGLVFIAISLYLLLYLRLR